MVVLSAAARATLNRVLAGYANGAHGARVTASDWVTVAGPTLNFSASRATTALAWEMNGQPLPAVHGGPVRVVVPGYIGARSVKWVEQITLQDHPSDNYFQATAYRLLPAEADPAAAGSGRRVVSWPGLLGPADVAGHAAVGAGQGS